MCDEIEIPIPPDFNAFDADAEVRKYVRNLPHWRQDGASYFVTFRLRDSIPEAVWREMQDQAVWWRKRIESETAGDRSLPPKVEREWRMFQRRYISRLECELDNGAGKCHLRSPELRKIVSGALRFFDLERFSLYAFVVMPNHCHVAFQPLEGFEPEEIIKSWKSFTARRINESLSSTGSLWQEDNFDRIIRDWDHYRRVVRYIVNNPSNAALGPSEYSLYYYAGGQAENESPDSF